MTKLKERITIDPAICHGKPTVRRLLYPVESILELLDAGMSSDEILAVLNYATRLSQVKRVELLAA